MNPFPYAILAPILTTAITLMGLGVLWGVLKTQVAHLRDEVDRLAEQLDRTDHLLAGLQEELHVKLAQQATKSHTRKRRIK